MTIKYFKGKFKQLNANTVWLVDLDSKNKHWLDMFTGYLPIGQHCPMHEEFTHEGERVAEITREEYVSSTKGIYTPKEYVYGEKSITKEVKHVRRRKRKLQKSRP